MFARSFHIQLPRRVTAYFLLFGLTAVVWLSAGAFYVARSVSQSRSESACLRWLGRGSNRISLDYLQHGDANLQALVHEIVTQSGADYCAIVVDQRAAFLPTPATSRSANRQPSTPAPTSNGATRSAFAMSARRRADRRIPHATQSGRPGRSER